MFPHWEMSSSPKTRCGGGDLSHLSFVLQVIRMIRVHKNKIPAYKIKTTHLGWNKQGLHLWSAEISSLCLQNVNWCLQQAHRGGYPVLLAKDCREHVYKTFTDICCSKQQRIIYRGNVRFLHFRKRKKKNQGCCFYARLLQIYSRLVCLVLLIRWWWEVGSECLFMFRWEILLVVKGTTEALGDFNESSSAHVIMFPVFPSPMFLLINSCDLKTHFCPSAWNSLLLP